MKGKLTLKGIRIRMSAFFSPLKKFENVSIFTWNLGKKFDYNIGLQAIVIGSGKKFSVEVHHDLRPVILDRSADFLNSGRVCKEIDNFSIVKVQNLRPG